MRAPDHGANSNAQALSEMHEIWVGHCHKDEYYVYNYAWRAYYGPYAFKGPL